MVKLAPPLFDVIHSDRLAQIMLALKTKQGCVQMKKQKLAYVSMTAVLACGAFSADAQSLDKSFAAFTACDASFFKSIATDQATWRAHTQVEGTDTLAWIKTKDRKAPGGNVLEIPSKPTVAGLPVTHYLDESSSLGTDSYFYYWGFKLAGTVDSVMEQIKPLVYDNKRLRKDDGAFVRTELKFLGKPWLPAATPSGSVPRAMTIERAFLIEKDTDLPDTVKVLCSLQGDLNAEVLQELRPDIAPKDYPETLDPELFNKVRVGDDVMQQIKAVVQKNALWTPKFKRVTYSSKNGRDETLVTLVNTDDGLLSVTEDYGLFKMQRQMLAGFVQTKSRFNAAGSIFVTEKLDLNLPSELNKGQTLGYQQTSQAMPAETGQKVTTFGLKCVVGDTFEASKIFASLTGRAVELQCTNAKGEAQNKAFLESLGIVITYTPATGFFGSAKPKYTRFSIEQ